MSTPLTSWYDYVLPDLPGLTPGVAALNLIRDGAIEFCRRSQAIEIDHPPVDLVANTSTYAFAPGVGLAVVVPKKVLVNGVTVGEATDEDLDQLFGDTWLNGVLAAAPAQAYRLPDESNIQLVPKPDTSLVGGLVMRVAVMPSVTATDLNDRLFQQIGYREAIAAYAKWKAKAMSKKPYSDASGAIYWCEQFTLMTGRADIKVAKGRTRAPLRTRNVHGIV